MKYIDTALEAWFRAILASKGLAAKEQVYGGHIPQNAQIEKGILSFYHISTPILQKMTQTSVGDISQKTIQISAYGVTKQKTFDIIKAILSTTAGYSGFIGGGSSEPVEILFGENLNWTPFFDAERGKWHCTADIKIVYRDT